MKSLYLTRIYPSHKIFTQAALVALMTFSMSDNIDNIIDNIDNIIERGPQPPGTIPISLDVVALYPSVLTRGRQAQKGKAKNIIFALALHISWLDLA